MGFASCARDDGEPDNDENHATADELIVSVAAARLFELAREKNTRQGRAEDEKESAEPVKCRRLFAVGVVWLSAHG